MGDDVKWPLIAGVVAGLFLCMLADAVQIGRLRADVDFLTTLVSRETLRSDDHV